MKVLDFFKTDLFYIFIVSLLVGLILGFCCPREYYAKFKMFTHEVYAKFHPDIEKDSKTIIMETVTKNTKDTPKTSIFEEPKKENGFLLFVKKVFIKKKKKEMTIHDIVVE